MAVARMKKVTIIGHRSDREKAVEVLQEAASMQIESLSETDGTEPAQRHDAHDERGLFEVTHCINFLNRFQQQQKGLLESFIGSKVPMLPEEGERALRECDWHAAYTKCNSIESRQTEIKNATARLQAQVEALSPWADLDIPLEEISDTQSAEVFLVSSPIAQMDAFESAIRSSEAPIALYRQANDSSAAYAVLYVFGTDEEATDLVRSYSPERVSLAEFSGTARYNLAKIESERAALIEQEARIDAEVAELLEQYNALLFLHDEFSSVRSRDVAEQDFIRTDEAFAIQGWVRAKQADDLKTALDTATNSALAITFEDPGPEDNPPVYLENSKWIEPFEMVTTIYGLPSYNEVDPTPLLAPFFLVFFGIALSDAAYGILLSLACLWAMKKFDMPWEEKKLFRLLTICGVSTLVFGAMMGGWFGDLYLIPYFGFMKRFRDLFLVIDPIENPLGMLMISLALGFIQIWYGIFVKMRENMRENGFVTGFLDEGSWLFLLGAIIIMVLGNAGEAFKPLVAIGTTLAKVGAVFVVVAQGRGAQSWLAKPFVGLYGLYGIIGYFSDMLSYARLLALGLATGVIASVVNQMALLLKPIPVLGPVIMLVALAGGHTFNLVINILGSFIHSGRLQFVEFFTKFFEGGGKAFRPFRKQNKYTAIRDQV